MSRRDFEDWTRGEVDMWPGAEVSFGDRGKHREAVVRFSGGERFVIYPSTPSDSGRAIYNHVADVRRMLVELGAERMPTPKSDRPKRERNPGADLRQMFGGEPAPVIGDPWEALRQFASTSILPGPGVYHDVSNEAYHRAAGLLPEPSISSSGLKTLLARSPRHHWHDSPLNPDRPPEKDKPHFNVGKAAHDVLLLSDRWPEHYHVLPEGFSFAKSKAMAAEIAEAEAARDAGKCLLKAEEAEVVEAMAASLRANRLASAALSHGDSEVTLVWKDKATGVLLRARPDFLPHRRQIIPDLKTAADASAKGFQRAIANFGYAQSAALYLDGIEACFGERPANWLHVVMEKEPPHVVALWELPADDIALGRHLNRKAINLFAECLSADRWPGYADEPALLGLPAWSRKEIDDGITPEGAAWADAA